jgi:hypothetical protein
VWITEETEDAINDLVAEQAARGIPVVKAAIARKLLNDQLSAIGKLKLKLKTKSKGRAKR